MNEPYKLLFSRQAQKDEEKLAASGLSRKARMLVDVLKTNPFQNPPPYEKLNDETGNKYSRRINIQHRLVYQVFKEQRIIRILNMWTHYE